VNTIATILQSLSVYIQGRIEYLIPYIISSGLQVMECALLLVMVSAYCIFMGISTVILIPGVAFIRKCHANIRLSQVFDHSCVLFYGGLSLFSDKCIFCMDCWKVLQASLLPRGIED